MDPYKTVGVNKKASQAEISKAFRKRAKKLHPDHGGNQEDFKELSKAYGLLKSPEKRKIYDKTGNMNAADQNPLVNIAIQRILISIDEVIAKAEDIFCLDIISVVEQHIEKILPAANQEIQKTKDQLQVFKDLKKRFKFKKNKKIIANDIVRNMLDDKIRMANLRIDVLKNDIKIAKIALKILDCYEFRNDIQAQYTFSTMTAAGTSSTSTW